MASYWICAAFTFISACVSLGYSIAAARGTTAASGVEALYALARSVSLAAVAVIPLLGERHDWLVAAATSMIVVQALDALIGAKITDRLKTVGPAATALVNLALLTWYISA